MYTEKSLATLRPRETGTYVLCLLPDMYLYNVMLCPGGGGGGEGVGRDCSFVPFASVKQ